MTQNNPPPPRVFISYSHDSPEHKDTVLRLSSRLRADGVESVIDQYEPAPPMGWARWMHEEIEHATFVLVVCTDVYKRRAEGKEEPGRGLGANREGLIIDNNIRSEERRVGKECRSRWSPYH